MTSVDLVPFGPDAQRAVERQWLATVRDHVRVGGVRALVQASWSRSLAATVRPDLHRAPMVLDQEHLATAVETIDWLGPARNGLADHEDWFAGGGHILTLFDREGRMLTAEGDPAALEGLAEINFRPGALWAEEAVGTNGPGTALATGNPIHIVGAEHFCVRWQPWHCAAVPIRELSSGRVLGVLDISGFREQAHPHTLKLALALSLAIEQALAARAIERRYLTLTHLALLTQRYPTSLGMALDPEGRILFASGSLPPQFTGDREESPLSQLVPDLVGRSQDNLPREVEVALSPEDVRRAVWHPVFDQRTPVGGCLLLESRTRPPIARRRSRGGRSATFADLVGESADFRLARDLAGAAARTDRPIVLVGEPGTEKDLFAGAIHQASSRQGRPFVSIKRTAGFAALLETADGGTVYVNEIGDLPPKHQMPLLRRLEAGESPRVILATSCSPATLVSQGRLVLGLHRLLDGATITLPPLRTRGEDVVLLARRLFLLLARELGRQDLRVDEELFDALRAYAWPGNLRELSNVVRRLVTRAGATIGAADLPRAIRAACSAGSGERFARPSGIDREDGELMEVVGRVRTMADAAAQLGISRSTLYRRMERYGLRPRRIIQRD